MFINRHLADPVVEFDKTVPDTIRFEADDVIVAAVRIVDDPNRICQDDSEASCCGRSRCEDRTVSIRKLNGNAKADSYKVAFVEVDILCSRSIQSLPGLYSGIIRSG